MTTQRAEPEALTDRSPRRSRAGFVAWATAAVIALAAVVILTPRSPRLTPAAHGCPAGLSGDPARVRAIRALLAATPRGRRWLAHAATPLTVCFDDRGHGALRSDDVFVLPSQWSDPENAARWAHLLVHFVRGPRWPGRLPANTDCGALVARVMKTELLAHVLEVELRRELGVRRFREPLAFEKDYFRAAASERPGIVSRFLATPRRGPSLVRNYETACQRLKRSTAEDPD